MEVKGRELIEFKTCKGTDHEEMQKLIAEKANRALFHYPSCTIQAPTLRSRNLQMNLTDKLLVSLEELWKSAKETR